MDDALMSRLDLFEGDPLDPDLTHVCPNELLERLTLNQLDVRLDRLIEQAHQIIDQAWSLAEGRMRAAWCVLFSGGNDSTILSHLVRDRVDYAVHIDTTIGIEQTERFVRDTCQELGLDLIVRRPPKSYRELVIENGFPGPAFHARMYQRLKERALHEVRRELVHDSRRERLLFIAGRRRSESRRRRNIPLHEVDGSIIWASPIAMWTATDMVRYRARNPDVPFNPVSDALGMSGECLCGAFAKPGELERIRAWYPDMAAEIDAITESVRAAGHSERLSTWGHGSGASPDGPSGRMCTSCDDRQLELFGGA